MDFVLLLTELTKTKNRDVKMQDRVAVDYSVAKQPNIHLTVRLVDIYYIHEADKSISTHLVYNPILTTNNL